MKLTLLVLASFVNEFVVTTFAANSKTTVYVSPSSNCTSSCGGSWSDAWPNINSALQGMGTDSRGDITLMLNGLYNSFKDKNINVTNANLVILCQNNVTLNEVCTLDCNGLGQGFLLDSSQLAISGLTIRNCTSTNINTANNVVTNVNAFGGALSIFNANTTLTNVTLVANHGNTGGAIYTRNGTVTFNGGLIEKNENNAIIAQNSIVNLKDAVIVKDDIYCNKSTVNDYNAQLTSYNNVKCQSQSDGGYSCKAIDYSNNTDICKYNAGGYKNKGSPLYCGSFIFAVMMSFILFIVQ